MKQIYENPIIEEIIIAPMRSLFQDNNSPGGIDPGGDVPGSGDGGDM